MNKNLYNAPEVRELNHQTKGILMMSTEGTPGGPSNGGKSSENNITSADANKRDSEWGNLW